ncbi:MAG: hypothetical protein ACJA14_001389 [Ilumatobacter sp.]
MIIQEVITAIEGPADKVRSRITFEDLGSRRIDSTTDPAKRKKYRHSGQHSFLSPGFAEFSGGIPAATLRSRSSPERQQVLRSGAPATTRSLRREPRDGESGRSPR